jgi:hypothetical protein
LQIRLRSSPLWLAATLLIGCQAIQPHQHDDRKDPDFKGPRSGRSSSSA